MNQFPHCQTITGLWTSVCMTCHLTIASSDTEGSLAAHELAHVCEAARRLHQEVAQQVLPGAIEASGHGAL